MLFLDHYFATCPRGLEAILANELQQLGAQHITPADGGVGFSGTQETMMRANLHSRVASRVLWRMAFGHYRDERDIYRLARDVDWPMLFDVRRTIKVKTDAIKSPLTSIDFVSLKIKDAVCDRFREQSGQRPSVDTIAPDMRIHAFLNGNHVTLYLDTSGEALFKRGWRVAIGEAPLRENLAAGILRLAGWTPGTPLFDPMMGSGTFLIEAADMALNRAPGRLRRFGFEKLAGHNPAAWQKLRDAARAAELPPAPLPIWGSDRDRRTVDAAQQNLESAGLENCVNVRCADLFNAKAPAPEGILVSNPPYGIRLDELDSLAAFYPELGHWLKREMSGWTAYLLTADLRLAKLIRLSPTKRTPLFNGALDCRLFELKMVAGGNRRPPRDEAPATA